MQRSANCIIDWCSHSWQKKFYSNILYVTLELLSAESWIIADRNHCRHIAERLVGKDRQYLVAAADCWHNEPFRQWLYGKVGALKDGGLPLWPMCELSFVFFDVGRHMTVMTMSRHPVSLCRTHHRVFESDYSQSYETIPKQWQRHPVTHCSANYSVTDPVLVF